MIVLQAIFSFLWQGSEVNENEILYVHSIDISTIKETKVYKTWESIHCTSDDSLKDSVNGKKITELLVAQKLPRVLLFKLQARRRKIETKIQISMDKAEVHTSGCMNFIELWSKQASQDM